MKVTLKELRRIVREVVSEAQDTPTMSAQLSPDEKDLKSAFPKWGNPQANTKQKSPAQVKAHLVAQALTKKGLTQDAGNKKRVTQELVPYIEKLDPSELFVAEPDELADRFAKDVLGVH